jgi:hypothetical protein
MEAAVSFAVIVGLISVVAPFVVLLYLRGIRKVSADARQRGEFKTRLAPWVKLVETVIGFSLILAIAAAIGVSLFVVHRSIHAREPSYVAGFLLTFPGLFAAVSPGFILANWVSWFVPAMRRANLTAMEGLPAASFARSNSDLAKIGLILIPLSAAAAALGVIDPWLN